MEASDESGQIPETRQPGTGREDRAQLIDLPSDPVVVLLAILVGLAVFDGIEFVFSFALMPLRQAAFVGVMGTVVAIAQTKAASSRAMATMTMLVGRPLACRRRYRWHNRTCAFQAL
jgi:hypothetical protein